MRLTLTALPNLGSGDSEERRHGFLQVVRDVLIAPPGSKDRLAEDTDRHRGADFSPLHHADWRILGLGDFDPDPLPDAEAG